MSLILDALNKADNERKQNQDDPPGIGTSHHTYLLQEEQRRLRRRWIVIGVMGLIFLLVCVYLLGRATKETLPAPATRDEQKPAQTRTPAPTANPRAAESTDVSPQKSREQQLIAQQYQRAVEEKSAEMEEGKAKAAKSQDKAATQKKPKDTIGELYSAAAEPTAPPATPTPRPTAKPTAAPTRAPPPPAPATNSLASFTNIGYVRELSYTVQQTVPTLMYSDHGYFGDKNDYVVINGNKVHKGGKAANGVTVEEILVDGVILKFQNFKFKMEAYSSWVNM